MIIRAVEAVLEDQRAKYNGAERTRMIELIYFRNSHTFQGAAMECHYSKETIIKWNREILAAARMALRYENMRTTE